MLKSSRSFLPFEKFPKFQRDMTHLIVHLVKINEARFLFDDIFSICTFLCLPTFSVLKQMRHYLQHYSLACFLFLSLFSLCSKGKSQAFSCLVQLPFILRVTWSFLLDELLLYAKHKKSLSFEVFFSGKTGGSTKLAKMKCHIVEGKSTVDKVWKFCRMLGQQERNLRRLGRMLS